MLTRWVCVLCAFAAPLLADMGVERLELDNGWTVLLRAHPGSGKVAIASFYRAGVFHEPEGLAHLSHAVEHLTVYSGTESYAPREAYQLLGQQGMANAETLASVVRYDYVVPSDGVEMALRVEAERLVSARFTDDVMAEEVSRCLQEVDFVHSQPQGGLIKFGLMGLNQVGRHGAAHVSVYRGA